jgi:hypothetical protein
MPTLAEAVGTAPPKMALVDLTTLERLDAQFNPTEFTETIGAAWASIVIPGLSHVVRQFDHTESLVYDMTLFFHSVNGGEEAQAVIDTARRFLLSKVYPRPIAGLVKRGGAPRLLFVWPGQVSITCGLMKLKFQHQRFNTQNLKTIAYTATITLEEVRDELLTSDTVARLGTLRTMGATKEPV